MAEGREHRHLPLGFLCRAPDAGVARTGASDDNDTRAYLLDAVNHRGYARGARRMRADDDEDCVAACPRDPSGIAVASRRVDDRAREPARTRLQDGRKCVTGYGVARIRGAREDVGVVDAG